MLLTCPHCQITARASPSTERLHLNSRAYCALCTQKFAALAGLKADLPTPEYDHEALGMEPLELFKD